MPYKSYVLRNRPAGYYRLDDSNSTTTDSSVNENTGTYIGSPTLDYTGGLIGDTDTAVLFNGSSQYVDLSTNLNTLIGITLSFEALVNFTALPTVGNSMHIVGNGISGKLVATNDSGNEGVYFFLNGLHANYYDGPEIPFISISTGTWHHIAAVFDGSTSKIFLNGVLQEEIVESISLTAPTGDMTIAATTSGAGEFFDGILDEVAVYNMPITDEEVSIHYYLMMGRTYTQASYLTLEPTQYLNFNEESGVVASDLTTNNYNGVYVGSPDLTALGIGGVDSAVLCDGIDDYIDIDNPLGASSSGGKSFSFFLKPIVLTSAHVLISNRHIGSNGFEILLNTDGTVGISWTATSNIVQTAVGDALIANSVLYHIGTTFDNSSNEGKIYINGREKASGDLGTETTSANKIRICGRWATADSGSDSLTQGIFDELLVFNSVLSFGVMAKIHLWGIPKYPHYKQLMLSFEPDHYWRFDSDFTDDAGSNTLNPTNANYDFITSSSPLLEGGTVLRINTGHYFQNYAWTNPQKFFYNNEEDFSSSFWFQPNYSNPGYVDKEIFNLYVGDYTFKAYFGSEGWIIVSPLLSINTWYHIACTYNGTTNEFKFFVDGLETYSNTHTIISYASLHYYRTSAVGSHDSNAAWFSKVLSPADIARMYNAGRYGYGLEGEVAGYVYDEIGSPIAGTTVRLYNFADGKQIGYTSTNEFGYYRLSTELDDVLVVVYDLHNPNFRPLAHGPISPYLA